MCDQILLSVEVVLIDSQPKGKETTVTGGTVGKGSKSTAECLLGLMVRSS